MTPEPPCYAGVRDFSELPLSQATQRALVEAKYHHLTAVQRAVLPHALAGRDVLGAAKTGSGKTLAFLIPVLEDLYRQRWTSLDGLGALILAPTRELGIQIFAELRKVGKYHAFSAGLLIGGNDAREESARVNRMSILVATPGRLLQHMDSTPGFDATPLRLLVLDEADRTLDAGFAPALDAIAANLPADRQTLLFSATQAKRVADLARLSLEDPEFIAVHAEAAAATPARLRQWWVPCGLPGKLDLLWFFVKTHLRQRTIVFFATCKQVRFVYDAFRKLRPGVPLLMLSGRMKQGKRLAVFQRFAEAPAAVLFATDVAARGLDFPNVHWVVQADCAEDVETYIHRVGRTARFNAAGEALLFLAPSEEAGMLAALAGRKVPIAKRALNKAKLSPIAPALTALLARSEELKAAAQGAFAAYLRSVFLNPDQSVFDVGKLDAAEYSASLGLPTVPRLRLVRKLQQGEARRAQAAASGAAATAAAPLAGAGALVDGARARVAGQPAAEAPEDVQRSRLRGQYSDDGPGSGPGSPAEGSRDRSGEIGRVGDEASQEVPGDGGNRKEAVKEAEAGSTDDEDLLFRVRRGAGVAEATQPASEGRGTMVDRSAVEGGAQGGAAATAAVPEGERVDGVVSAARRKRKRVRITAGAPAGQRVVFDDDGQPLHPLHALSIEMQARNEDAGPMTVEQRFALQRARLKERDRQNAEEAQGLRKEARAAKRARRRAAAAAGTAAAGVVLAGSGSGSDVEGGADSAGSSDCAEARGVSGHGPQHTGGGVDAAYTGMAGWSGGVRGYEERGAGQDVGDAEQAGTASSSPMSSSSDGESGERRARRRRPAWRGSADRSVVTGLDRGRGRQGLIGRPMKAEAQVATSRGHISTGARAAGGVSETDSGHQRMMPVAEQEALALSLLSRRRR